MGHKASKGFPLVRLFIVFPGVSHGRSVVLALLNRVVLFVTDTRYFSYILRGVFVLNSARRLKSTRSSVVKEGERGSQGAAGARAAAGWGHFDTTGLDSLLNTF